jgi:hypothetical protein
VLTVTAVLSFTLVSCTTGEGGGSTGNSPDAPTSSITPSRGETATGDQTTGGTPIDIRIGGQTLSATVWDNPAGAALLEQMPLTLNFEDLNGEEKIGHLPDELPMEGMPEGDDPEVGDLGYYAPWGNVVLYYGDVSYWDGIARIGRIDAADLAVIAEQSGDFTATMERDD